MILNNERARLQFEKLYQRIFKGKARECILDICTGSGIHLPLLSHYAQTVIGIDISYQLLLHAQKMLEEINIFNVLLLQAAAESLPLRENTCDGFVIIDALHHVENQTAVLCEIMRVAKPHASFLLIEPNLNNPLVYIAHRIPAEERGALRTNTRSRLSNLLSPFIKDISIEPFNYIASRKKNIFNRILFFLIEQICAKCFSCLPIRILIAGRVNKA
ncbi:MAG: class I SAM-dependent methyltransferase [Candidatus Omnitrophica bacterium]|nr:class I SAM-dependent methyltransferase [Candidatus Omnitrophota bacterium]